MLNLCVPPSLSAAMWNVGPLSSNPVTKVPLVIATTTAFFAVVLHWLISLRLHIFEAVRCSLPFAQSDIT